MAPEDGSGFRLGHLVEGAWVEHSHPSTFEVGTRIVAGVPGGDSTVFANLVERMSPPYYLLYLLHTPRGEAEPGRYQSPPLSLDELKGFLARFAAFFRADARFDLWAHSPQDDATVVWDRHNLLFGYGPVNRFAEALLSLGFTHGVPQVPVPHEHHYRSEFDHLARDVVAAFDWSVSALSPEDEQ